MDIPEEEFNRAFPSLSHCKHPSLANGYGWLGNGFGWQLEPLWGPATSAESKTAVEVKAPEVFTIDDPLEMELADSSFSMADYVATLSARTTQQNFYKLRDEHLQKGTLFEDPDFPATINSLRFNPNRNEFEGITWLRPKDIAKSPQLFVDENSRFGVLQGNLHNCWFAASVANLAMHRNLLHQVIPEDQSFDENYAGIFRFRFWQYGKWIDLVIDDRLPTKNKKLCYMKSETVNEFWSALLEKAYAKLYGCYQILQYGFNTEGLQDLTGGVSEIFQLHKKLPNIFKILINAFNHCSLASILIRKLTNNEFVESAGLKRGHCYTITSVVYLNIPNQKEKTPLLRLRNPWGQAEWNGAWSDKSPEWNQISADEKKNIEMKVKNDGEFWMSFGDFERHCDYLEICHLTPDLLSKERIADPHKKTWELSVFEGNWVKGLNAGGKDNNEFNPQYRITLTEADEDEDDSKCTLIIALMQKYRRAKKFSGVHFLPIGFVVYSIPSSHRGSKRLNRQFFKSNSPIGGSPGHFGRREVNCRLRLSRGTFCIIPSTPTRGKEASFLLRVFSENNVDLRASDDDIEFTQLDARISNRISTIEEQEIDKRAQNMIMKLGNLDIGWLELKGILDSTMKEETKNKGFSEGICRSIVALSDQDRSGKLDYEEFDNLWIDIKNLKAAFKLYDEDDSGTLNGSELRDAFNSSGYVVNGELLTDFVLRYGNKESELNFETFILCALKTKAMIELFKSKVNDQTNTAQFSFEELSTTLYS